MAESLEGSEHRGVCSQMPGVTWTLHLSPALQVQTARCNEATARDSQRKLLSSGSQLARAWDIVESLLRLATVACLSAQCACQ
eukprot:1723113-Amphidinium_carterae.3